MQAFPPPPAEGPLRTHFGRSGRLFFLVWSPAHLHHSVRLSFLPAPPLCPMLSNVSLFFSCCPPYFVPLLGSFGGFNPCFWVALGLPSEGLTPLSSPPYPSLTFPPAKLCLSCVVPSLPALFENFDPPFLTASLSLLSFPMTPGPVWPLSAHSFSPL